jgi:hypothetical protein
MSMLYIWHPSVSKDGHDLELILTRGDSDQIGAGCDRFIAGILRAIGISAAPDQVSIKPYRCNFYGEYWQEEGWQSQWDFVWRLSANFRKQITVEPLQQGYLGTDEIDDYSELIESYRQTPFSCLVIGAFSEENLAQAAARKVVDSKEVVTAWCTVAAPIPSVEILRVAPDQFQVRAAIGAGDEDFFTSGYPAAIVAMFEAAGGVTHAQN